MIKFSVNNVKTCAEAKKIGKIFEDFNKDKKNIWLLKDWVTAEAIGQEEPVKVIYIDKGNVKEEKILKTLTDFYKDIGGDETFEGDTIWVPSNLTIEVLSSEVPKTVDISNCESMILYKVNTGPVSPSQAFDMVNHVREIYGSIDFSTELWTPKDYLDVEVKYIPK